MKKIQKLFMALAVTMAGMGMQAQAKMIGVKCANIKKIDKDLLGDLKYVARPGDNVYFVYDDESSYEVVAKSRCLMQLGGTSEPLFGTKNADEILQAYNAEVGASFNFFLGDAGGILGMQGWAPASIDVKNKNFDTKSKKTTSKKRSYIDDTSIEKGEDSLLINTTGWSSKLIDFVNNSGRVFKRDVARMSFSGSDQKGANGVQMCKIKENKGVFMSNYGVMLRAGDFVAMGYTADQYLTNVCKELGGEVGLNSKNTTSGTNLVWTSFVKTNVGSSENMLAFDGRQPGSLCSILCESNVNTCRFENIIEGDNQGSEKEAPMGQSILKGPLI
jgi:hypothetical protein